MAYKITQSEIDALNVQSIVGDALPGNTIADKKELFDKLPEFICSKFNDYVDHVEADFIDSNDLGDLSILTTDTKTSAVNAINEVNLNSKYHTATADTNGDFKVDFPSTFVLSSGDIVKISFPSATDNTKDARLSVDDGTTYINIYTSMNIPADAIENQNISFVYDGTNFVPLDTVAFRDANFTYYHYPDGKAEADGSHTKGSAHTWTADGNLYRSDELTVPFMAGVFNAIPITVSISPRTSDNAAAAIGQQRSLSSTSTTYAIIRTTTASVYFISSLVYTGRWK